MIKIAGFYGICLDISVNIADYLDRSRGILRGWSGEIVGSIWLSDIVAGAKQELRRFGMNYKYRRIRNLFPRSYYSLLYFINFKIKYFGYNFRTKDLPKFIFTWG